LFSYYLTSRKVDNDFDKLVSLMVADRLKEEMPTACLKHVLGIETSGDTLSCDKLAEVVDVYMHSHLASGVPRMVGQAGRSASPVEELETEQPSTMNISQPGIGMTSGYGRGMGCGSVNTGKACYECGSHEHLANFHRRNTGNAGGVARGCQRATGITGA